MHPITASKNIAAAVLDRFDAIFDLIDAPKSIIDAPKSIIATLPDPFDASKSIIAAPKDIADALPDCIDADQTTIHAIAQGCARLKQAYGADAGNPGRNTATKKPGSCPGFSEDV